MKDKIYLIDSNIIIYHLNDEKIATEFLYNNFFKCAISQLTFIEVLSFNYEDEERLRIQSMLESFCIIDTTTNISLQAINNRAIKKIKIADNIIASTAQVNNFILVTRNTKDFNSINVKLFNPFEQEKDICK